MKSASQSRIPPAKGAGGAIDKAGGGDAASAMSAGPHLFYETAPLAYLNFDGRGRILGFNPAASQLMGASRKLDLRRPLAEFISPRHHRRLEKHVKLSQASQDPVITRLRLRADGEVELSTRPASEGLLYRSLLIPLAGETTPAVPDADAKFRALVENSSEVICIGGPDGTIFYTTPAVERILGYDPRSWFGRNAFEIMRPDQAALARVAIRQLAATPTGTVLRLITQVRHQDGSWKWVEGVLTNLIGQPDIGGIVCNYRDITDSRRAEQALRASEQRYRLLAESLPQMISIRDSDGHIEYCNSHWREYRGMSGDAMVHDWRAGIPEEDRAALLPPPWENNVPRQWEAECRIRRVADDALRWHTVRVVPLPRQTGAGVRWLAIASDIHERKQVEQERERLVEQLERERSDLAVQYAVVRVLAESSSLADATPRLLAAFCDQLGWEAAALWTLGSGKGLKGPRSELSLLHIRHQPGNPGGDAISKSKPAPLRKGESLAGRVWEKKKPLCLAHLPRRRGPAHYQAAAELGLRDAFAFPILLDGQVQGVVELLGSKGEQPGQRLLEIVGAIGIQLGHFIQRTGALEMLRQSEEALIQVNNALEQRVRARTAELREANSELSSEIVERTRLEREIIRISEREQRRIGQDLHDGLCQELAAIALMTRAQANRLARGNSPETPRINHLARLLNDSITRCRDIARGLHPVEMDSDGLMVALQDLALRTDQTISCAFRCDEPILMPESDMALNLYRIAQEAVNNAIKYSNARRITIALALENAALRLSISDDGRGIPSPRRRSKAAATASPRPLRKRAGMGLHIMRYRARTMGATLQIHDRPPHGTEVVCLLPRK